MDKEHATPDKPGYRLVGQPPMTVEERAAFLQQARSAEAKYDNEVRAADPFGNSRSGLRSQAVHVAESNLEFIFHTNNPESLVKSINAQMSALEENAKLLSSPPSYTPGSVYVDDREWLQDQMKEMHGNLTEGLSRLEKIYKEAEEFGPNSPSAIRSREGMLKTITDMHAHLERFESEWIKSGPRADIDIAQKADVNTPDAAWHKKWTDPSQPLQFTESLRRSAESGREREPARPPAEFKPNTAPDNPRALYTNSVGTEIKQVWHQDPKNFPYDHPASGETLKRASKLGLVAMGLLAASEAANATPGSLVDKLSAAGHALKDIAIDAVPSVTYAKKMQAGQYEEAMLDAASYLPFGDLTELAISPEVQAVIDALPKNQPALKSMIANQAEPPINRHLAEYQLLVIQATAEGNLPKYLAFSSDLNNLAEKKLKLQPEWAHNAEIFAAAIQKPDTNWKQLASNYPDIAPHIAIHLSSLRSGHSAQFVSQMDAQLTDSLAKGIAPILHPIAEEVSQNSTHAEVSLAQ